MRIDSGFKHAISNIQIESDRIKLIDCMYAGYTLNSERIVDINKNQLNSELQRITFYQIASNYDFACIYMCSLKAEISKICFNVISNYHEKKEAIGATCIFIISTSVIITEQSLCNTTKIGNHISIHFKSTTGEAKYINQTCSYTSDCCRGICEQSSSVRLHHIAFYNNIEGSSIYFLSNSANYEVTQIIHSNTSNAEVANALFFYISCTYSPIVTSSVLVSSGPNIVYPITKYNGWFSDIIRDDIFVDLTDEWPVSFDAQISITCHRMIHSIDNKNSINAFFVHLLLWLFHVNI